MQYNIINKYEFDFKEQALFNKIIKRTQEVENIEKNYVLSVIFVNDNEIHEINKQYRNIDRPTDVISFASLDSEDKYDIDQEEIELGDIFINIDACKKQADDYGHSFSRELCFLFTHGICHLLGYDHMNPNDEKKMIAKQKEILNEIINK